MLGFTYHRSTPSRYVALYRNGKIRKQGMGLTFLYRRVWETVVEVPTESKEVPFIVSQITDDYQEVAIDGHLTFRIGDPTTAIEQLDFTVRDGRYISDDWIQLPDRLLHIASDAMRAHIGDMSLKETLNAAAALGPATLVEIRQDDEVRQLGLEILAFRINAIKASLETSRALEARERERILQDADEAIFRRRNASVEQERVIKENELNTELAVQDKEHQLMEKRVRSEEEELQTRARMDRFRKENELSVENTTQKVVALQARGTRITGEAEAVRVAAMMKAYNNIDPAIMDAIKYTGMNPVQLLADGFRELAKNQGAIGQLNVTPEVLQALGSIGTSLTNNG